MVERIGGGGTYKSVEGEKVVWTGGDSPSGRTDEIRLIAGLDGVVSQLSAAVHELRANARNLSIIADRTQQMYGYSSESRAITTGVKTAVEESLIEYLPGGEGGGGGGGRRGADALVGPPEDPENINPMARWEEYERRANYIRRPGGGISLGNLKQDFGRAVESRIAENVAPWGPQLTDEGGAYVDEGGNLASRAAVAAFLRNQQVAGGLRAGAGVLAQGGTIKQAGITALPGAVARGAGVASGVLYAANEIGNFAERQRAENAQWQRITGGDNLSGFGERARQQMFGMSQFGVMDSAEAERLYRGVAELGLQGEDRTQAQAFALDAYKDLGMTIEQSLEVVRIAARSGQESLTGLARTLRDVTDSAKEAGVNTEQARQQFVRSYETLAQTMGGQRATQVAGAITAATAGLGDEFTGVSLDIGSEEMMYTLAGRAGMGMGEFMAQPWEAQVQQFMQFGEETAESLLTTAQLEALDQWLASRPRERQGQALTSAEMEELNTLMDSLGVNRLHIADVMSSYAGVPGLTAYNVMGYIASQRSGIVDPLKAAEEQKERQQPTQLSGREQMGAKVGSVLMGARSQILRTMGIDFLRSDQDRLTEAYAADRAATGREGGISEALISDSNLSTAIKKVKVQEDGKDKIVSFEEAMRRYRSQIDAGTAVVAEGTDDIEGQTMAQVTQMEGADPSLLDPNRETGRVVLEPTDELRRLIRVQSQNGSAAWREEGDEYAPPPAHLNPNQRPTGNP